jgi:hypothetical protein
MKWNTVVGSLVLGASLCAPSFGGGLLDRMLGMRGSGCDSSCCDTGCAAAPTCGCEIAACDPCGAAPSCGCEIAACDPCGAAPSCGCEIACDPCGNACDSGCGKARRRPLMELLGKFECAKRGLFSRHACDSGCAAPSCGCEVACDPCGAAPSCGCEIAACDPCGAAPSCGCEIACNPCGSRKHGGLLSKLFKRRGSSCCDAVALCDSGCSSCSSMSAPLAAPVMRGDAAPMPPAPVVDPSAYLQSNRRVIQATSYVR